MPPRTIFDRRIREAAALLSCSIDLILTMEREGDIPPARRTGGGHRVYNDLELDSIAAAIRERLRRRAAVANLPRG